MLTDNLHTPSWFKDYSYLTVMGSRAFNTANEDSDWDFYGFCVPPVEIVFPHRAGYIQGFGRINQNFENFQFQHVPHPEYGQFDIVVYSIVKYFQLVMNGNPNMVDSLFVPEESIVFQDEVGKLVRENRKLFLSQKCYHTFKGMMWSHLSRLKDDHTKEGRKDLELKYGWDTKDGGHSYRMVSEVYQILFQGDLNIQKDAEVIRKIREGEFSKEDVIAACEKTLEYLEQTQDDFVVPYAPPENKIKTLLVNCLEIKFGSLEAIGFKYVKNNS